MFLELIWTDFIQDGEKRGVEFNGVAVTTETAKTVMVVSWHCVF